MLLYRRRRDTSLHTKEQAMNKKSSQSLPNLHHGFSGAQNTLPQIKKLTENTKTNTKR